MTISMLYRTTLDIGEARLKDVDDILTAIRGIGAAELDHKTNVVAITFDIGSDGIDLWDLRGAIEELEAELSNYLPNGLDIAKPTPVETS